MTSELSTPSYVCSSCNKSYVQKHAYDKHVFQCVSGGGDLSFRQLSDMVYTLSKRVVYLEDELKKTNRLIESTYHRKNIVVWMNQHMVPYMNFDVWKKTFDVADDHIINMMNNGVVSGYESIIRDGYGNSERDMNVSPLYCFVQKPDSFWVYSRVWRRSTPLNFSSWFYEINRSVMSQLYKWKNSNAIIPYDVSRYNSVMSDIIDSTRFHGEIRRRVYDIFKK